MTQDKLTQFKQFFQIDESIQVNLFAVDEAAVPNNQLALEQNIPTLFKLANEVSFLEQSSLRSLRQLSDVAEDLAVFLKAQSRKIDLIMSHILAGESEDEDKINTLSYGGGGFTFETGESLALNSYYQCKLFLPTDASAVFCYAQVIECVTTDDSTCYTLGFCQIRELDQELLVRASLRAQSRVLKQQKSKNSDVT
jgi:hypothetical protein